MTVSIRSARLEIIAGRVSVAGSVSKNFSSEIDPFNEIAIGGRILQKGRRRIRIMLNKPVGFVSATTDLHHPTVLDLIDHPARESLHLAGRLDRSSTGLVLVTNDSLWSENLSRPEEKVEKVYIVETAEPIPQEAIDRFQQGFYFACEDIVTRPALLELLGPCRARVTLTEGKYHQIKRMFHRINKIRLVSLHRVRIGEFVLPEDLSPGEWREIY